jgi:hypothetical protein
MTTSIKKYLKFITDLIHRFSTKSQVFLPVIRQANSCSAQDGTLARMAHDSCSNFSVRAAFELLDLSASLLSPSLKVKHKKDCIPSTRHPSNFPRTTRRKGFTWKEKLSILEEMDNADTSLRAISCKCGMSPNFL